MLGEILKERPAHVPVQHRYARGSGERTCRGSGFIEMVFSESNRFPNSHSVLAAPASFPRARTVVIACLFLSQICTYKQGTHAKLFLSKSRSLYCYIKLNRLGMCRPHTSPRNSQQMHTVCSIIRTGHRESLFTMSSPFSGGFYFFR